MYRALCKAAAESRAVVFSCMNKESTSVRLISGKWENRKGPSVLEYCVMKILEAFIATEKFMNQILIF